MSDTRQTLSGDVPGPTLSGEGARRIAGQYLRRLRDARESGIVIALILVVAFFSFATDYFWSIDSIWSILSASAIAIPIAAGMTAVILARQIDLSIGAVLGIAAYGVGVLLNAGIHPILALLLCMALGALLGAVNGLIVTWLKVPAIIATLGTATIYRGLLFIAAPYFMGFLINADQIPGDFRALSRMPILGLPITTLIGVAVAVIVGLIIAYTPWGRSLYVVGSNPDAARFAGISTDRVVFFALVLVGVTAGLGGFLYVMRYASVGVRAGIGLDFEVISAAVVGGVAIFGGAGRVFGAVLGVIMLNTLGRGFVLMDLPEFWKVVATGGAIIAAVTVDAMVAHRRSRRIRMNRRLREISEEGAA
jgi:rhamnose transport system permease protein